MNKLGKLETNLQLNSFQNAIRIRNVIPIRPLQKLNALEKKNRNTNKSNNFNIHQKIIFEMYTVKLL